MFSDAAKLVATTLEGDTFGLDTFAKAAILPAAIKKSRLCITVLSFFLTGLMPGNYNRLDGKQNRKVDDTDVNLSPRHQLYYQSRYCPTIMCIISCRCYRYAKERLLCLSEQFRTNHEYQH